MRISQSIQKIGIYTVVKKLFLRNQQNVETTSFYANDVLWKRTAEIRGNHIHKFYSQLYDECGAIDGTRSIIDFLA